MGNILKIENLRYKNILNNISFSLEEETFNILIGPNGSGKTTLIKSIVGLIKYEGSITFLGELVSDKNITELRKNIGMFTSTNILLPNNVLYNLIYPLLNLNYTDIDAKKKAYEISKKLGISDLLLKRVSELSISETKIVSFAVSLIHNPKLVIIDDSFDELDSINREKIIKYLKNLNKKTILFITNNESDIMLADNLIIMKDGKISIQGKFDKIIEKEINFTKNNVPMPFMVDLSHKLKSYDLIDNIFLDMDEMVSAIWK